MTESDSIQATAPASLPSGRRLVPIPLSVPAQVPENITVTARQPQTITDQIGQDYTTWDHGRVLIDAGCGTGKTFFILHRLVDWTPPSLYPQGTLHKPPVLYLCNRCSLKKLLQIASLTESQREQIELQISEANDFFRSGPFQIRTYQTLEKWFQYSPDEVKRLLSKFKFIVADECHYFHCDSPFNPFTDLSKKLLEDAAEHSVVIYMSATAQPLFQEYREDHSKLIASYQLKKEAQIIQCHSYSRDCERVEILDTLPQNEKAVIFVRDHRTLRKMKQYYGDSAGYYCSYTNANGPIDKLEDCIQNGILLKQLLFTTTAMYNGIDIKDHALKHILIELGDPTDIEQAIGRKRPVSPEDTFTLYLRCPSKTELENSLKKINDKIKPVLLHVNRKNSSEDMAVWIEYSKNPDHAENIEMILPAVMDEATETYVRVLQESRFTKWCEQKRILEEMLQQDYLSVIQKHVSSLSKDLSFTPFRMTVLANLLLDVQGQKYPFSELKAKIIIALPYEEKANHRASKRGMGIAAINTILAPYGFQIKKKTVHRTAHWNEIIGWIEKI